MYTIPIIKHEILIIINSRGCMGVFLWDDPDQDQLTSVILLPLQPESLTHKNVIKLKMIL